MPVGLWHDGHTEPRGLECAANHGGTKRWVVNISIGREQDYINVIPSPEFELFFCCG